MFVYIYIYIYTQLIGASPGLPPGAGGSLCPGPAAPARCAAANAWIHSHIQYVELAGPAAKPASSAHRFP